MSDTRQSMSTSSPDAFLDMPAGSYWVGGGDLVLGEFNSLYDAAACLLDYATSEGFTTPIIALDRMPNYVCVTDEETCAQWTYRELLFGGFMDDALDLADLRAVQIAKLEVRS